MHTEILESIGNPNEHVGYFFGAEPEKEPCGCAGISKEAASKVEQPSTTPEISLVCSFIKQRGRANQVSNRAQEEYQQSR